MKKDLIDLTRFTKKEIVDLIDLAKDIKVNPKNYSNKLYQKTLLMIFEKPSLRTRVSFEVAMTELGGHAIYYDLVNSPMGKKESVADTAKTASRYVSAIMARLNSHEQIIELAQNSSVPVINGLTNFNHPVQILSDLLTISEKKGVFQGLKLAYLGDSNNNVTHSLLFGCAITGIDISVGCPKGVEYEPNLEVLKIAQKLAEISGAKIIITQNAKEAIKNADIVYTDSWMSYHIPKSEEEKRIKIFMPYQVNADLLSYAKSDAIFMNCLPAMRGMEQTAEVIDGPQSVVFDQAENRLHIQKAILLSLVVE